MIQAKVNKMRGFSGHSKRGQNRSKFRVHDNFGAVDESNLR